MHELKEMLCRELEEITAKGELNAGDLDTVHKLTDTIKNILKIDHLEGGEYSHGGDWSARGSYSRMYDGGNSYGRHYVRGHYSRSDGMSDSYGRYGRYSRGEGIEHIAEKIEAMMNKGDLTMQDKKTLKMALEYIR